MVIFVVMVRASKLKVYVYPSIYYICIFMNSAPWIHMHPQLQLQVDVQYIKASYLESIEDLSIHTLIGT